MTCRELVEFLDRYLGHELEAGLTERFEAHLSGCDDCRRYVGSYRSTIDLAAHAARHPEAAPPQSVPDDLVQAILAAKRGIRP